jgi:hypothetical protein
MENKHTSKQRKNPHAKESSKENTQLSKLTI